MKLKYIIPSVFLIWAAIAYNNCGKVTIDTQDGNLNDASTDIPVVQAPLIPIQLTVTGVTPSSASLSWQMPMGKIQPAFYEIQTNSTGESKAVQAPAMAVSISGLNAETVYDFRVRSCSEMNQCSEYSENVTATTLVIPDTAAPNIPTGLSSNGKTQTTISLVWNASIDNVGVVRYEVRRNNNNSLITAVNAPSTTTMITGLTANTAYTFDIQACDASNNCSGFSSDLSVTTMMAPDTSAPTVPANLRTSNLAQTTVTLLWNASTDNVGVTGYELSIDNGAAINVTGTSYNATGFAAGSTHNFKVLAKDAAGNKSAYATAVNFTMMAASDTSAPTVPSNPTTSSITSSSIVFSWTASTDNVGVAGYDVSVNNGTPIATSNTNYSATGLSPSTTYQFKVRAKDAAGNLSAYTTNISATTSAIPSAQSVPNFMNSRVSVSPYATVQATPAKITLQWASITGVNQNSMKIYKRDKGTATWTVLVSNVGSNIYSYEDTAVVANKLYEYKFEAVRSTGETGYGYLTTGINVQPADFMGRVILVVDSTTMSSIGAQITSLENSLIGDGFLVDTISVSRTATAPQVLAAIKQKYVAGTTKHVYLFGHVPVPYSGTVAPDGHGEHNGAWPADGYYGDMNSTWTTGGGNVWAGFVTGDRNGYPDATSKFSASSYPTIELGVGRVDMFNLSLFSSSESQLLTNYINKSINFKKGNDVPQQRAMIKDNLEWVTTNGWPNARFSRSAWSSFSSGVGPANITASNYGTQYFAAGNNQSYLYGYGAGGGSIVSADGIGSTTELAGGSLNVVFNHMFGSYFGDWDMKNNFLRAVIAGGKALTNLYVGEHQFWAHDMSMGGSIGDSVRQMMNNTSSNFNPASGGGAGGGNVYLGLQGDPTLKAYYPKAATNLTASGGTISWTAASGVEGYNVYQVTANSITKLNGSPITGTSYNVSGGVTGKKLMVRSIKTQVTPAGSFINLGNGVVSQF